MGHTQSFFAGFAEFLPVGAIGSRFELATGAALQAMLVKFFFAYFHEG